MEVVVRQFEQLQQILGTIHIPISLLRLLEKGNQFRQPVFGGGYMNGPDLVHVCIVWEASSVDKSKVVSSYKDYIDYVDAPVLEAKAPVGRPKGSTVRKKKVAVNG